MTEIAKLIERLENAEAGSRELDAEIAVATLWKPLGNIRHWVHDHPAGMSAVDGWVVLNDPPVPDTKWQPPQLTASLDAAVALVERLLPGQEWSIGSNQPVLGEPWARIRTAPLRTLEDSAPTPALALCLATLKALEARDKSGI